MTSFRYGYSRHTKIKFSPDTGESRSYSITTCENLSSKTSGERFVENNFKYHNRHYTAYKVEAKQFIIYYL